jgi:hypothetical protein
MVTLMAAIKKKVPFENNTERKHMPADIGNITSSMGKTA